MKNYLGGFLRILFVGVVVAGSLFSPQYSVLAARALTVTPITWNIIGLDSNNVNVGPNHFPVGVRVCNTSTAGETLTNVKSAFVFDDGADLYTGDPYINLRANTLAAYTSDGINLAPGACKDFYYEVAVTRDSNAYNKTRNYHITASSDGGAVTGSTPTPRQIFVEHLVSQERNSVLDVQLDGVSIAAGGTMNLVVGNTYTIKLISKTATNGYEQLETFINFPNTIFQILSVASTYTANAGTDPDAATKLYADGCGWIDATRTCTTKDKYGGTVTVTYVVKIISGGGTSQPLNTLIYDFSGSSYHYNNDFDVSTRIANILDPTPALTIVKSVTETSYATVGTILHYSYLVTNTGNVTLSRPFTVTDDKSTDESCPATPTTLAPGQSITCTATYTVTQADLNAGSVTNIASAHGFFGTTPVNSPTDTETVNAAQIPQLSIVKTQTSSGPYIVGNTITYNIVVTNTGNITLTGVTVTDNSADLGDCTPPQPATLAPGATMTCPASHVVTEADLENKSYVNTAETDSEQTDPVSSTVTVSFDEADLSLTKVATNTTPDVSTNINFIITVTNGGPDDATGVEVIERLPNGFTFISASASRGTYNSATAVWQIGNLALNESVTLNMEVRVNASGSYINTAEIAKALVIDPDSTPNNQVPTEDDQSSVTLTPRTGDNEPGPRPTPTPAPQPPVPAIGGFGFLIPVTGFAPNVVSDLSHAPYASYTDTSITLDIPSLSVNIPIVGVPKKDGTWNVSWLANQAGWLEGSAFPSWNGNSVLTSHVYLSNGKPGPFAKLHELKTGDQVIVHAFGQKYTFEVLTNAIVAPTDKSVMRHEEKPWLTLVTCTDYDAKTGTYKNRFIVRAVLVKVSADK